MLLWLKNTGQPDEKFRLMSDFSGNILPLIALVCVCNDGHKAQLQRSQWRGGVVVIRSPHDPEVPSSNPGKNNTSDFSIRDPLSLPSCNWYRIYLAMWWNSSVGRAADLIYTCQVRCRGFDSRCFPHI